MWPLEQWAFWRRQAATRSSDCLRIGANAVERWTESPLGMTLTARQPITRGTEAPVDNLIGALRALYGSEAVGSAATLVIESAWLPLLLVDTGGKLWSAGQVESLFKYRLGLVHGEAVGTSSWEVRTEHLPGERHALGFGMPRDLKQALLGFATDSNLSINAIEPAFTWARRKLDRKRSNSSQAVWWLWEEQDRMIIACLDGDHVIALNPSVMRSADPVVVHRMVRAECARNGIRGSDHPLVATTWESVAVLLARDPLTADTQSLVTAQWSSNTP